MPYKITMNKIKSIIKLQIKAGEANPSPPIGPALGAEGVNIMKFCQEFNANTNKIEKLDKGTPVPVIITVFTDKSFKFIIKSPPASVLLKKIANISKGSGNPNKNKIATINMKQIEDVVDLKIKDLIVNSKESAMNTIKGTAKSMGFKIDGD